MLSCGNKVSPASLLTHSDQNSAEASGLESQLSQVSLFSGSEIPSSLELFSQPLNQTDNITGPNDLAASQSDAPRTKTAPSSMHQKGKKYYMKYLSSFAGKHCNYTAAGGASIVSNDSADTMSSKVQFEAWKDKQQDQLERKKAMADVAAVMSETVMKLNKSIDHLRADMQISKDKITETEESSSQWENRSLDLFTQLLQGQEETKQMMLTIQNELSQQKNMLKSFSNQLSSMVTRDTTSCISVVTDKIIEGVSATLQRNAVSTTTVGTQTSVNSAETSNLQHERSNNATDQAVPVGVVAECDAMGGFYSEARQPSAQACESSQMTADIRNLKQDISNQDASRQTCLLGSNHVQTDFKIKEEVKNTVLGKRRSNGQPPTTQKEEVPCKSNKRAKQKEISTHTTVAKRRSSRTRKPPKQYAPDYCSSGEVAAVLSESKIKRKPGKQQPARNARESSLDESPVNALSDALYSDTCTPLELLSGVTNSQNVPPKTAQVKFHRRNEAAKRRKMVISNLTDPELLLQELQDCIINRVNTCDPSP